MNNFNFEQLLELLAVLSEYPLLITLISFLIQFPIMMMVLDGFKYSENSLLNKWQKLNFVIIILGIILLLLYLSIGTVYASDGRDDIHSDILNRVYHIGRIIGSSLGDGTAAAGGATAMAKTLPKGGPLAIKGLAIVLGAGSAVLGKKSAEALSQVTSDLYKNFKESSSQGSSTSGSQGSSTSGSQGSNSGVSSTQGTSNSVSSNIQSTNSDVNHLDVSTYDVESINNFLNNTLISADKQLTNTLIENSNNLMLYSTNDSSYLLGLINSSNLVEKFFGCLLMINIILLILTIMLIICFILYRLKDSTIELKNNYNMLSETKIIKINSFLKKALKFYSKSVLANIVLIFSIILFSELLSIYLINLYISDLEIYSNYYLNNIKK